MPDSSTSNVVVEAIGLTKIFKDFWGRPKARAVNGIDFRIRQGQVFGLLGPNGSGKSTTVKMILGLLYPTRGTLRVFGEAPEDVDIKQRVGYLPEETYLYKYLTAAETLDFFGALFGLSQEERQRRGSQLLEMVGLANSFNRPVGEFSKGMARRIGLAQALVNDPDLVILDEPTSGLDPIGCREVKDVIRLLAERGKTVMLCSHLLADVQDVCDQVVVLYGGKIRTEGALADILTVESKTRIVTPRLEAEVLDQLMAFLGKHVPLGEIDVDRPSMNLEDFFLNVVREARDASLETAGAQAGGRIAAYLRGEEGEQDTSSPVAGDLLQALSGETDSSPPEAEPPQDAPGAPQAEDGEHQEARLQQLMHADEGPAKEEESAARTEEREQPVQQVSERLQNLLENRETKDR